MRDINHLVSRNKNEAFAFAFILKTRLHQCCVSYFPSEQRVIFI